MQIITYPEYPPIPFRNFDWSATRSGYEPGDAIGWGSNPQEAIQDLHDAEEERLAAEDEMLAADFAYAMEDEA